MVMLGSMFSGRLSPQGKGKEDLRERRNQPIVLSALFVPYYLHPCYNQRKQQKSPSHQAAVKGMSSEKQGLGQNIYAIRAGEGLVSTGHSLVRDSSVPYLHTYLHT